MVLISHLLLDLLLLLLHVLVLVALDCCYSTRFVVLCLEFL